jgi:EmrB/QacA subfamily drug resistance transporter
MQPPATPLDAPPEPRRWLTLFVMCGAFVMTMIDATGVAVALPSIQKGLGLDQGQLQWIITLYTLTLAATLATGGRIGDQIGRLPSFVTGVLLFVTGSVICGLAPVLPVLLAGRLIEGLGNVLMVPVAAVLASEALGPAERGRAMSIYSAAGGASMVLGPLIGGALAQSLGWRAVFFVNVPVAAITLLLLLIARPRVPARSHKGFDFKAAPLLIAALGMLVLGLQESHNWHWTSPQTIGLVGGGAALLGGFVVIQLGAADPLLDVRLFQYRYFSADAIVLFCAQFAVVGQSAFIAIYFQRILQFSPLHAGLAVVCLPIAWIVMSPVAGRMYDRAGVKRPVTLGLALIAAGFLLQVATLPLRDFPLIVPGLLLIGAGLGLAVPQTYTDGMAHVPAEDRGQAYGLLDTVRQLGGALGMAAVGTVVAGHQVARLAGIVAASAGTAADRATLAGLLRRAEQGQQTAAQALAAGWPGALPALRIAGAHSIADGFAVALAAVAAGLVLVVLLLRGTEPVRLATPNQKELVP